MGRWLAIVAIIWAGMAQAWEEPERGSPDRAALMDALRPDAERLLGAPIDFVIFDLRREGDVAFSNVAAVRPGGKGIDIYGTPGVLEGDLDPEFMDGTTLQALYRKSGDTWVAVHWEIGATDVWYADPYFCPVYGSVLDEVCGQ